MSLRPSERGFGNNDHLLLLADLGAALALYKTGRELDSAPFPLACFAADTDVEIRGQALQALKLLGEAPSPQPSPAAS